MQLIQYSAYVMTAVMLHVSKSVIIRQPPIEKWQKK